MGMVFCRGCGKELHETAPTCPQCGAPQGNLNSVIKDIKGNLSDTKENLSKFTHTKKFSRVMWSLFIAFIVIMLIGVYVEEQDRQSTERLYQMMRENQLRNSE
jgi:uncharacterized membrane protein YvbJ